MNPASIWNTVKRSWMSQFWINFATMAVLALSLGMVFGAALISKNASRLLAVWGDEIQITIYLQDKIDKTQVDAVEAKLKNTEFIAQFDYIDKTKAAALFEKSLKGYGPQFLESLKTDVGNPFPAAYHVQLKPEFKNPEKVNAIAEEFKSFAGVEDVSYGQEWVRNYTSLVRVARVLGILFGIVTLVGCLFTVSNSIRASLSSRREEIEILELVGATNTEIRRPFIIEGAVQGLVSSTLAIIVLAVIYTYSSGLIEGVLGAHSIADSLAFFDFIGIMIMLIFGVVVGGVGSYLCVSKINTGWAAAEGVRPL